MKIIKTSKAPAPIGPYNQAIIANGFIFISGQIAIQPENEELLQGTIEEETERVMKNLGEILKEAGSDFNHVVKCSIFVKDMGNFGKVNEVYGRYFSENAPARETVEVSDLPKSVNVEISCIAATS